ncbi:MAG: hypothetical protein IJ512_05645 [Ruminococcus sp.]|nr:hypothetical protein [Ruminococcus sp.]
MNVLSGILCLAGFAALWYWLIRPSRRRNREPLELLTVREHIDQMQALRQRLDIIEDLLTELETCSPDTRAKGFRLTWTPRTGGQNITYDFLADGVNRVTADLIQTARNERELLRSLLLREMRNYPTCSNANSNANSVVQSGEGSTCRK